MRTIEELKAYAMAATGRGFKRTEEYLARLELVRLAEDHPELYNTKYFQAALDEQRRREAVLTKRLDDIKRSHSYEVENKDGSVQTKLQKWVRPAAKEIEGCLAKCRSYIKVHEFVLGTK
ncbi:MAG: hypothetical protein J6S84_09060 [Bacteroidales bacterium]|nr:hypothetical protein [Bacteroidales bacterium]